MLFNKKPYLSFFISSVALLGAGFTFAALLLTSDGANDSRSLTLFEDPNGPLIIPPDIHTLSDEELERYFSMTERRENLRKNVENDFVRTHYLTLDHYEYLPNEMLFNGEGSYHNLASVLSRVISNQSYGDIIPYAYYNDDHQRVMIFDKKVNGDNVLHIRKYNGEQWEFVNRRRTPGVKMVDKHWEDVIIENVQQR
ncbi:hypothetical protein [Alkalihalobacterium chitinilyticum]|uniref:Uncharacterized protein n=1 Tax=Alkalihalobacterium chitinilyticum TaxID=2980103 RepID=A0ABT5VE20_9BACI|nr:hypothetical protein [Alkalihalobacterium chitinilyticum]MDE5413704.1 hypothetical protein [Alkalihalobacterium chitinilyticum]